VRAAEFARRREALGLTKAELARQMGLHRSAVTKWEQREPPSYAVAFLAMLETLNHHTQGS